MIRVCVCVCTVPCSCVRTVSLSLWTLPAGGTCPPLVSLSRGKEKADDVSKTVLAFALQASTGLRTSVVPQNQCKGIVYVCLWDSRSRVFSWSTSFRRCSSSSRRSLELKLEKRKKRGNKMVLSCLLFHSYLPENKNVNQKPLFELFYANHELDLSSV